VDVATGVEGSGYRKDPARLRAFVEAVRAAEKPK
jgi:phosphoribosylanthranilate isomerase